MFVSFEGLDGAGKTTQVELLAEALLREGREVVATREPGGTPLGEELRRLLLHAEDMAPWAEAALFAAARAELVHRVIRPALERGADVICDRYVDSSLAYQGIARELGVEAVLALNRPLIGDAMPDRTFLLLLDPETARNRGGSARDRIEREGPDFWRSLDDAYRRLAALYPERIVPLDGSLSPEELAEAVRQSLVGSGALA